MKVRIKRLSENAVMPKKAHSTDAGFDLVATRKWYDEYGNACYGTGLAFEIPKGHVGLIFPRSSISKVDLSLSNAVGVIDSGFRGEVTFKFRPAMKYSEVGTVNELCMRGVCYSMIHYEVGDRIGQLIIVPLPKIKFKESEKLSFTDRGTGGYGSSGR